MIQITIIVTIFALVMTLMAFLYATRLQGYIDRDKRYQRARREIDELVEDGLRQASEAARGTTRK